MPAIFQMPAAFRDDAAQLNSSRLFKCDNAGPCVVKSDVAAAAPEAAFGWKSFRVVWRVDGLVALQTFHGSYLQVPPGSSFVSLKSKDDAKGVGDSGHDDTGFEVVNHRNGSISMRGAGGAYLSGAGNGSLACTSTITPSGHFIEIEHKDATISLRSFDGSLVDAERLDRSSKRLTVREQPEPQSFALVADNVSGTASLRSFYGTYLSLGEGGTIEPWSASVGAGEKFVVEGVAGHSAPGVVLVRLKWSNGQYLTASDEGRIVVNGSAPDKCATFHMKETGQGSGESNVTVRTCHGGYLSLVVVPIHTFYLYRSMGDNDYPMENVNAANLGGVLWYLHNEVVNTAYRKFGITRIIRFKVSMTATDRLASLGMSFGVRFAYDSQTCTGAGPWNGPGSCDKYYQEYGNFVGCNSLGKYPFPMASQGFPVHYADAKWYSLPKEGACRCEEGKACTPTGADDCTYTVERAGEIYVSDLESIGDYNGFVGSGQKEYDQGQDKGVGNSFWDQKFDDYLCSRRIQALDALFRNKNPEYPGDRELPEPDCDFSCENFYRGINDGPPEECNQTLQDERAAHFHPVAAPGWIMPPR